jgi:hypothetical protein
VECPTYDLALDLFRAQRVKLVQHSENPYRVHA